MFDTMTLTKVVGAGCGALLVFLLVGWAGQVLYVTSVGGSVGGHGDRDRQAYLIETGSSPAAEQEPADIVPFADLVAAADVGAGQRSFGKCAACHRLDGSNGTGPHLDGVVDRQVGGVDGFAYSAPMIAHAAAAPVWTLEELDAFIASPRGHIPGTRMTFAGIPREQERANLVAYLVSLQ